MAPDSFGHSNDDVDTPWVTAVLSDSCHNIGFATINASNGSVVTLSQFAETSSSFSTLRGLLQTYSPMMVLLMNPLIYHTSLKDDVEKQYDGCDVHVVAHGQWDVYEGLHMIDIYGESSQDEDVSMNAWTMAAQAVCVLLRFIEREFGMVPVESGIRFECLDEKDTMMVLQSHVVEALNVFQGMWECPGTGGGVHKHSLYRLLNRTKTKLGARLLRANLSQPYVSKQCIQNRLDAVEELAQRKEVWQGVSSSLQELPKDPDMFLKSLCMITCESTSAKKRTNRRVAGIVQSFIDIKLFLESLMPLRDALGQCESVLLGTTLLSQLGMDNGSEEEHSMLLSLFNVLEEDITKKNISFLNRTQQCFALKKDVFPMLEIFRNEFTSSTEAVNQLANHIRQSYDLPDLTVSYTEQRGFYFTLPKRRRSIQEGDHGNTSDALPTGFFVLVDTGKGLQATTDGLNALNIRIREASDACIRITEEILEETCAHLVQEHLDHLRSTLDSIAEIDVVCSLAELCMLHPEGSAAPYTKPVITSSGPLIVEKGRHPILESIRALESNGLWLDHDAFHLITGPNMSGKTTFLRQIGILTIMAQVGCFVPASFMSLTPFKSIKVQMTCNESSHASAFEMEMKQAADILKNTATPSLVLMDEFGRSMSMDETLGMAWAVAEELIMRPGVSVLFATHTLELYKLASLYPQCSSFHFAVDIKSTSTGENISFVRHLASGRPKKENYGIHLAKALGYPPNIVRYAERVAHLLEERVHQVVHVERPAQALMEAQALKVWSQLKIIKEAHGNDMAALKESLKKLKDLHFQGLG